MKVLLAVLTATCAWGQLDRPMLGMMVDSAGTARPLLGLPGSISVGDPSASGVLSAACSAAMCLLKTGTAIVSQGQSTPAPPGPARFAFSPTGAYIYFPESKQLAFFHGGQLDPLDFEVEGEILSIRADASGIEFAVRRDLRVSIVRSGNLAIQALPPDTQDAMLLDTGVLYATREAVVVLRPDASSMQFSLTHVKSFTALGSSYVQIRAGGSIYALRVDTGRERLFLLPEPGQ